LEEASFALKDAFDRQISRSYTLGRTANGPATVDRAGMNITLPFLGLCWSTVVVYVIVPSLLTRVTVEERSDRYLRVVKALLVLTVLWLGISRLRLVAHGDLTFGVAADVVTLCGACVLIWARTVLAANWSGSVQLQEDHELIIRGPYRYARHPMYSGLLIMVVGGAIFFARPGGVVVVVAFFILIWLRVRREEAVLKQHFPEAYPAYKRRVNALVPFVF
jgi:protein-S-isoprenylcysteine O-methyltransferase Ste14